jgi:hypothetical protein
MSDFDDKEHHQIVEIRFKATNAEANAIWLRVVNSPEWQEYDALDDCLRYGHWQIHLEGVTEVMRRAADRKVALRAKLSAMVIQFVKEAELE